MRKQRDQWQVHQSQNWPGEIYSQTSASHILTDIIIVQEICLGRRGEDCSLTFTVRQAGQDAQSIASQFGLPVGLFEANNYCDGSTGRCPQFPPGTVSFWILDRSIIGVLSLLLTDCVHCTLPHWETPEV